MDLNVAPVGWDANSTRIYTNQMFLTSNSSAPVSHQQAWLPANTAAAISKLRSADSCAPLVTVPACGMSDSTLEELQQALAHRHSMLQSNQPLLADLWQQLQQVLETSEHC